MSRLRVLALASYPDRAASTRFRVTAYERLLADSGIDLTLHSVLDDAQFARFYRAGGRLDKGVRILGGTARQIATLLRDVDVVLVQREATLLGPAFIEWLAVRFRRLPLVYDLDDAVWTLPEAIAGRPAFTEHPLAVRLLRYPQKTWSILRFATHIIAGSQYLAQVASRHNPNVTVLPTVVSREEWKALPGRLDGSLASGAPAPVIGWVGSHSTTAMLEVAVPALRRLRATGHPFTVRLIGARDGFSISGLECETLPWNREREVRDFQQIDVGIAPLLSIEYSKGKCGFKQLEYMAVGVPCVSSAEGGALDFMVHGENGLLARTDDEWFTSLSALLGDRALRARIARNGRALVERSHSIEAQAPRLADVLWRAAASRASRISP